MPRYLQYLFAALIAALIVGAPFAYSRHRQRHYRHFHAVEEGVLYRSGQLSLAGLKRVLHDYGIRTVVTLRDADVPAGPPPDRKEEDFCRKLDLNYHRITPRPWGAADGSVPAETGVSQFRQVMSDPANYPVLVHCFAGVHRTGAYCAVYRMEHSRWSNERAITEMVAHGYHNIDTELDLLTYLEQYVPTWARE